MKKIERFWNIVHYFVYRGFYRLHLLTNKINILLPLYKTKFAKRRFEKMGIKEPYKELNYAWARHDYGLATLWAGGFMGGLVFFFSNACILTYIGFNRMPLNPNITYFVVVGILSYVISEILLFRKDKYMKYFKEFDKMKGKERSKWRWISVAVIFGILIFQIGSFVFMLKRHP